MGKKRKRQARKPKNRGFLTGHEEKALKIPKRGLNMGDRPVTIFK